MTCLPQCWRMSPDCHWSCCASAGRYSISNEEESRCTCGKENDVAVEREADVHLLTHQGPERLLHTTEREPPNRTVRPSVPRPDRLLRRDDPEETYSEGQ